MKLVFSEAQPDYTHYIFPYAVWAFPEPGETPADFFAAGFLPSTRTLDRFYLCRQIRVDLKRFQPSSENRRILRKGANIESRLVPRAEFSFTPQWRVFCQRYADARFQGGSMTHERLDSLFSSPVTTHLLVFMDRTSGKDVGVVTLYREGGAVAFYYYSFYDLDYLGNNLGMHMMTTTVCRMAEEGVEYVYLGTCYSAQALYKTQFPGTEFFNGYRWSENLKELKHLLGRQEGERQEHLLEEEGYRAAYCEGGLEAVRASSAFGVRLGAGLNWLK
jgi:arginyl-tRNA--protein-N-Asp/Glu arginylyltransferase